MDSDDHHVIFDISSDEEDFGSWDHPASKDDELDWLSELLEKDDKGDESDEVVVLSEVKSQKQKQKQQSNDDDDDCLILDGDPDKPVQVANQDEENGSDELLIVGEKGQLACRDYAHSRDQCARFPFSTTPHAKYCNLCHCYVCDSPAPCFYWGTGVSNGDHCHSTNKEAVWREQRKCFKQSRTVQPPVQKLPQTAPSVPLTLHKSGPALGLSQPLNSSDGPLYMHKSTPLRACSSANSSMTRITNQRNSQRPGFNMGRNRFPHHWSRSHVPPGSNVMTGNIIRRDRSSGGGSLGPRFVPPYANFKRVGSAGVPLGKNQPGYEYSYDKTKYSAQPHRNHYTPVATHYNDVHNFVGIDTELNACQTFSQPNIGTSFGNSYSYNGPLQPPVYGQPIPQSSANNLYPRENLSAPSVSDPNLSNFDLSLFKDTTQSVSQSTGSYSQQLPSSQSTSEPSSIPHGPPRGTVSAPATELDLDSWLESLEHHQPDLETAKDTVSSVFDFASHQEELANEAMLMFDFENS